jgi:Xaa-Pro dipeptidase
MKKALQSLRAELRPGMTVSDADRMVRNILHENKVGARLITRSGYSIGIAFPPSWDEGYILSLNQGQSDILKPGMTFHIIPWLWGIDGDKTCGISDTFYITEDGCGSFFDDVDQDFTLKSNTAFAEQKTPVTPIIQTTSTDKSSDDKLKSK